MTTNHDFERQRLAQRDRPAADGATDAGVAPAGPRAFAEVAQAAWLASALDEIDYGVMLVEAGAVVRFANSQALDACGADGPLQIDRGRVGPRRSDEQGPFLGALAAACDGLRSMLQLRPAGTGEPFALAFVPLEAAVDASSFHPVLLTFGRRQPCESLSLQFFARACGLTGAESAVLAALCRGLRPGDIASLSGTAISTVRSQIGSVRQKTGSASIGELVRRLTLLPPIVGVLKGTQPAARPFG